MITAFILTSAWNELVYFAYGFLTLLSITLVWLAINFCLLAREYRLTKKAYRETEQYNAKAAKYRDYQDGFGMKHLLNLDTNTVENLSTFPGSHHNGQYVDPPPAAAAAWYALVGKVRAESPVNLLPSTTQQESQLDLLTIFTQPTQSYAIIAGQQVGKTFQARRLAQHWLSVGCKPIVIGPKWDRGEWEGCTLFGGEYQMQQVNRGMQIVKRLAEDRHSNKELSHKQHAIQPVFFDDWTAIRANLLAESEAFILDATTLYASVNIILYFIIHLDTANAWGVGKVGAALHQNFYKLFIEPGMNEVGLIDRSRNIGWILMPGQSKRDRKRVSLYQPLLLPDVVIQPPRQVIESNDDKFVRLVRGGMSRNQASKIIWDRAYAGDIAEHGKQLLG